MKRMENYQGDLADIVRASGGATGCTSGEVPVVVGDWQFPSDSMNYRWGIEEPADDFGDPFSDMRDPLLHNLGMQASSFFHSSNSSSTGGSVFAQKILDEEIKRPCNIFSRMLQISPCDSPRGIKNPVLVANDMISANSSKACLAENTGLQISSPRNTGIKRRKSQAKTVVCIPAPAPAPAPVAANNRPSTGEVVPSDLWAWRKYGQKPIKGSPYPRGYYRCSSSKGCSARKQVERSRTDPNMLVITYTCEHNHPWPTQRNALAGSTRSQPSKNINNINIAAGSKNSPAGSDQQSRNTTTHDHNVSIISGNSMTVVKKEEMGDKQILDVMDDGEFSIHQSHNRLAADSFADLVEIEADPLNLLFSTQGLISSSGDERENNTALNPFSLFDWTGNTNTDTTNTIYEEVKRNL